MMSNSGKTISFYYLDHLAGKAYFFSFAPENITKAFELPGIYPLNQLQLNTDDFASSNVTKNTEF